MDLDKDADIQRLREATAKLAEHFDFIQVVAGKWDGSNSNNTRYHHGIGSYYARYGLMREWLLEADAKTRADAVADDDD